MQCDSVCMKAVLRVGGRWGSPYVLIWKDLQDTINLKKGKKGKVQTIIFQ